MIGSDIATPAKLLFGDTNGVVATDPVLLAFVNDAMREIARETLVVQNSVSTTGNSIRTSGHNLAALTDFIVCNRVTYDGKALALLAQEPIDRLFLQDTPDGEPAGYYFEGQTLKLFPRPLAGDLTVVIITYSALPTPLSAALSETIGLPDSYRTELIDFVTGRLHQRNENWRAAETYDKKFASSMAQRKYEGMSRDDTFYTVSPDVLDQEDATWNGYMS